MAFCNNANLLNVFVRHIANNQLRSLAEVATVAHQLKLLKDDFFASDQQAVAVADRYPQDVFAEHTHDFCELVIVWRGNGLHVLNDRPYRITRGDLFYIHADDKHSVRVFMCLMGSPIPSPVARSVSYAIMIGICMNIPIICV